MLRRLLDTRSPGPSGPTIQDAAEFVHAGARGRLCVLSCDAGASLSGLLQFRVAWTNLGDIALPSARLILVWTCPGGATPCRTVRQPALALAALNPGAEVTASVQLGVPFDQPCTVELAWDIEDSQGASWRPSSPPPTRRLDVTPPAGGPDFDYLAAYRSADLAHDWWSIVGPSSREEHDATGKEKLLQLQALGLNSRSRILDIGCGTGQLADHLAPIVSAAGCYVGTDIAPEAIAFCAQRISGPNIRFLCNEWAQIPLDGEEFDFVYLGSVLPHLYPAEIAALLPEACRLLAAGGQIIVDAFVSPTVPIHAGNRGMVQLNEAWLRSVFTDLGLEIQELGSAPWSADCRRAVYRLTTAAPDTPVAPNPCRDALLILGMHRSGTSVVTRLLDTMGAAPPVDLAPGGADNPDGYWEPSGVVRAMEELLAAADSAWFDWRPLDAALLESEAMAPHRLALKGAIEASFGTLPRIALKDPRACRAVGLFRALLAQGDMCPRAILVLRNPAAVAASLKVRDSISATYAGLVWARHMTAAEAATRDMPRLLVDYDALIANPAAEIARIVAFLPWPVDEPAEGLGRFLRAPAGGEMASPFGTGPGTALAGLHGALAQLARRDDAQARAAVDAAAGPVEAIALALAPALEAEFAHLRASGRNMQPDIARPAGDTAAFAAAMERLHDRLVAPAVAPPRHGMRQYSSTLRDALYRGEDIYAGVVAEPAAVDRRGWNSDHPLFGWCIEMLRPRLVIEVGSWKGGSAIAMARAMDAHGVEGEVLCVDTWLGSPEHWLAEGQRLWWWQSLQLEHGYPQLYRTFLNNVVATGLQHRITPLPLPGDAAFQVLRKHKVSAGLIYIDAAHDEESVARDLRLYWQLLAPGGALVADDYDGNWPGVRRAVDSFVRDNGLMLQAGGGKALLSRHSGLRVPSAILGG